MNEEEPIRVAIIGGGCASMTTAFELTRPEHCGKYEVVVYQQGWRLGGKGASGRGKADRIEEHGLHIWLGFYENAFRIMRDCYAEAGRDPSTCPIATWRDAFIAEPYVGVADFTPAAGWVPWTAVLPSAPGEPGDPLTSNNPFTMSSYMVRLLQSLRTLLEAVKIQSGAPEPSEVPPQGGGTSSVMDDVARLLGYGRLTTFALVLEALRTLETIFTRVLPFPIQPVSGLIDLLASAIMAQIGKLGAENAEARRLWEVIDLVLAITRGCVRHGLLFEPKGFDALDEYDCRDWMKMHGASEASVNGAFVRGLYDLAFGYEDGDISRPKIAAGQAIRGALRFFFTYRGQFFWKMTAGMGDVVFAPLYEVLKARGVRFEFFHRLENVGLSSPNAGEESVHVNTLTFDVQAEVKTTEYQPLVDVRGLPCWPAEPNYSQLKRARILKKEGRQFESIWDRRRESEKTLSVGEDFDFVVLGVAIGVIPYVCGELLERDARWRDMVQHVKTVSTQALQIWMDRDMAQMGWSRDALTITAFVEPFDTWADMRHLIPAESWGESSDTKKVRAIAYFCNVLPDLGALPDRPRPGEYLPYVAERGDEVRDNAVEFLNMHISHLWPAATYRPGEFRWDCLVGDKFEEALSGEERIKSQWVSANVSPSERYTLSIPGSTKYRISPLDNTYDNLTIAGDWTDCGFNEGCVEAAVMSGRLAAHALSGLPRLEAIIGYDHP